MKKNLVWILVISPLFLMAQDKGIAFEQHLSWQQILEKAKTENKFVFVDCYASWCGPCKWMDQEVYSKDTVGLFMNRNYIAVRLHMDTTRRDDEEARRWYATAHALGEQYQVNIYPSFLFFSPDGRAVHKDLGVKNIVDFLALAANAMDPRRQFYTVSAQYRQGDKNYAAIPWLAKFAEKLGEDSLSSVIARDYLYNYLTLQPREAVWTKENLAFIASFQMLLHWGDPLFSRYFADRGTIDSILGGRYKSAGVIDYVVYQDEVLPAIKTGISDSTEPDWHRLEKTIEKKYARDYIVKNVLQGRVDYYKARKQWVRYARYLVKQLEADNIQNWPAGIRTSYVLNNDAFEVFQYSHDKNDLGKATSWIDRSLAMNAKNPQALDTKANLLYKLGKRDQALAVEAQSLAMAPKDKEIAADYAKMKSGLPTWEEDEK